MKHFKLIAIFLAALLCLSACGTPKNTPEEPPIVEPEVIASPDPESGIPDASTNQAPTTDGKTYETSGIYLGMADNNLLVIIEANPEDGKPEKSYQISPTIDLNALGITEGDPVQISYIVDADGIKRIHSISKQY